MELAARTAAWAKSGGCVNPYVTDGLVAMWDGEWNAGWGVHDPNATAWKDLVGNNDCLDIHDGEWGDSCLRLKSRTNLSLMNQEACSWFDSPYFCIEWVKLKAAGRDFQSVLFLPSSGSNFLWDFGTNNHGRIILTKKTGSGFLVTSYTNCNLSVSLNPKLNENTSSFNIGHFTDGKIKNQTSYTASEWPLTNRGLLICGNYYGSILPENYIDNFCIRVYERPLESHEIAANYAIDKTRFNLPDAV